MTLWCTRYNAKTILHNISSLLPLQPEFVTWKIDISGSVPENTNFEPDICIGDNGTTRGMAAPLLQYMRKSAVYPSRPSDLDLLTRMFQVTGRDDYHTKTIHYLLTGNQLSGSGKPTRISRPAYHIAPFSTQRTHHAHRPKDLVGLN